ncbi:MAG TPA: NAD(P)H-dependent oxidoreductase [Arachidicoccus sp.]
MKKIFIINAGQDFGHSGGKFNKTITENTIDFFSNKENTELRVTNICEGYNTDKEVENFVWADYIIYHTPIWWFQLPHGFKKYIDEVFTAGHRKGIYLSDGRNNNNPEINYGTGGMLHGRKYLITTSWNAPAAAFTLPGEFFGQTSVDEGILFGFHKMNAFTKMQSLESFHFHDVLKNAQVEKDMEHYKLHLQKVFSKLL